MSHLFVDLGVMLVAVYAMGQVFELVGKPAFLGEIAAGVVVGPELLGLVAHSGVVHVFATVGAASLFFHVGFAEVDLGELLAVRGSAAAIAAFGMLVPFLSGIALGTVFGYSLAGTLFIAVALSITSIAITVRTLSHLGESETTYASKLVGAAIIDDVAGMVAFSLLLLWVASASQLTGGAILALAAKVVGFFALAVLFYTVVADRLFEHVLPTERTGGPFLIFGAILALFAAVAEVARLHASIGAFVAGLVVSHSDLPDDAEYEGGVTAITYGVFAPVFFGAIGTRLDLSVLVALDLPLVSIVVVGVLAKIVGGYVGNRVIETAGADSLLVGIGMVPRTGVELVIVSVALDRGFIDQHVYAGFILLVVVSVIVTPLLLERLSETPHGPQVA